MREDERGADQDADQQGLKAGRPSPERRKDEERQQDGIEAAEHAVDQRIRRDSHPTVDAAEARNGNESGLACAEGFIWGAATCSE